MTYEAIRISSGNSFVHETESQVILNGSRDINFTMDLVLKDIGLFQAIADAHNVPLEISPQLIKIFQDGQARYARANGHQISSAALKRLAVPIFWHPDFRPRWLMTSRKRPAMKSRPKAEAIDR